MGNKDCGAWTSPGKQERLKTKTAEPGLGSKRDCVKQRQEARTVRKRLGSKDCEAWAGNQRVGSKDLEAKTAKRCLVSKDCEAKAGKQCLLPSRIGWSSLLLWARSNLTCPPASHFFFKGSLLHFVQNVPEHVLRGSLVGVGKNLSE